MDDREIMENLLLTTKGACDLYMHGSIEASTADVNQAFHTALDSALCMQQDIYQQMSGHGWYAAQSAPAQERTQLKQKYANGCC